MAPEPVASPGITKRVNNDTDRMDVDDDDALGRKKRRA